MINKTLLRRFSLEDGLYFGSYGLFLITSLLSTSFYYRYFIGYPYSWLQVVCLAMLIFREYRMGGHEQNWIALAVLMVMAALSLQFTIGNLTRLVPLMFFYIYGARNLHFICARIRYPCPVLCCGLRPIRLLTFGRIPVSLLCWLRDCWPLRFCCDLCLG